MRKLLNIFEDEENLEYDDDYSPELEVFFDVFPTKYANELVSVWENSGLGGYLGASYDGTNTILTDHFNAIRTAIDSNPSFSNDEVIRRGILTLATQYRQSNSKEDLMLIMGSVKSVADLQTLLSSDKFIDTLAYHAEDMTLDEFTEPMAPALKKVLYSILAKNYKSLGVKFAKMFSLDQDEKARKLDHFEN